MIRYNFIALTLAIITCLQAASLAQAAEVTSETRDNNQDDATISDAIDTLPTPDPFNESCTAQMKEVKSMMKDRTECWTNGDCLAVRFGCPWEAAGCDQTIISIDDPEALNDLTDAMVDFEVTCVDKTPGLRDYCNAVNILSFKKRCATPTLVCLNGTCVTQTQVLIQGQE